jgi:hypothetical protein
VISKYEPLGLELDLLDGRTLQVAEVRAKGSVWKHNATAPLEERVLAGDFIVSVDGLGGSATQMLQHIQNQSRVMLEVCRPAPFKVVLSRTSSLSEVGMTVQCADEVGKTISLVVVDIQGGLLSDWNRSQPGASVRVLDRIVKVNGIERNTDAMLEAFQGHLELTLEVVRPRACGH